MDDLASRLANRVQLTSDGHKAYLEAVEGAFGSDIDYAMLVKIYGQSSESEKLTARRSASARSSIRLKAIPIPSMSAHHLLSGKISTFVCTPDALLG
jgi:hypothetical protein